MAVFFFNKNVLLTFSFSWIFSKKTQIRSKKTFYVAIVFKTKTFRFF